MEFTHKSGMRYLWVDSLCIVQDDGDAKMIQINAMDRIYSYALATIINTDGVSCHSGLPGVAKVPRHWKQRSVTVPGVVIANKYQQEFAKQVFTWNSRGWTFQEQALSRRCIHIGLGAVNFESEDGLLEEDMHPPPHVPVSGWKPTGIAVGDFLPNICTGSNIFLFALSVLFYPQRSLTFDTNAIKAFQGVLNIHQPRFRRDFIYAMPSSELEIALLWQPASALRRRVGSEENDHPFPSWSWVAWKGGVIIPTEGATRFSRIKWVDAIDMTTEFTSDEWRGVPSDDWHIVPNRGVEFAPWYFEENDPDTRYAHPVSRDIPQAIKDRQFLKPNSHVLTFNALKAQIRSFPGHRSLEKAHDEHATSPDGVSSYELRDQFDRFCGIVYLHTMNPNFSSHVLDCVCISRTAFSPDNVSHDDPPSDDSDVTSIRHEYAGRVAARKKSDKRSAANYFGVYEFELKWQAYDILVIAQASDGIAERIGVGFCLCEAFWDAQPKHESVQLK